MNEARMDAKDCADFFALADHGAADDGESYHIAESLLEGRSSLRRERLADFKGRVRSAWHALGVVPFRPKALGELASRVWPEFS